MYLNIFLTSDVAEFRDCFLLFARNKVVTNPDELTLIMRSLGFSPTIKEIDDYFAKNHKGLFKIHQLLRLDIGFNIAYLIYMFINSPLLLSCLSLQMVESILLHFWT